MNTETIRSLLLDAGPATPPAVGLTIGGRYELRRQLARTGFSTVFRALDHRLRRVVCAKFARPRPDDDDPFALTRACLLREARMLRLLEAHAISAPRLVDIQAWSTPPVLVMTYVPGQSLEMLRQLRWISDRRAAEVVRGVARLLARVHRLGIVHHDVKPANIQVRPDGSAVLLDWGLAQHLDERWVGQGLALTPDFASPARLAGAVSLYNDVFALARTLEAALMEPHSSAQALVTHATIGDPIATIDAFGRALDGLLFADRLLRLCGLPGWIDGCW